MEPKGVHKSPPMIPSLSHTHPAYRHSHPRSLWFTLTLSSDPLQIEGCCFQDVSEIQEKSPTILHKIPESQFQRWQKCWTHIHTLFL